MPLNEIERGQLASTTIQCFSGLDGSLRNFPGLLKRVIEERAWERRVDHHQVVELKSLRELIVERPIRGWGEDPHKIEAVIKDDAEVLAMFREAMKHQGERSDFVDIVNEVDRPDGNSRAYAITRVKRHAPEHYAAVLAGEVSPHAALVQAGLRPKTWTAPADVERLAAALERRYPGRFVLVGA